MPDQWTLLIGLTLAAAVAVLAKFGLRCDRYRCSQSCSFRCPRFGSHVDCELVQDLRTGQWKDLRSCSLFARAGEVPCDWHCVRRLNLGLGLEGWRQKPSRSWCVP